MGCTFDIVNMRGLRRGVTTAESPIAARVARTTDPDLPWGPKGAGSAERLLQGGIAGAQLSDALRG